MVSSTFALLYFYSDFLIVSRGTMSCRIQGIFCPSVHPFNHPFVYPFVRPWFRGHALKVLAWGPSPGMSRLGALAWRPWAEGPRVGGTDVRTYGRPLLKKLISIRTLAGLTDKGIYREPVLSVVAA